MLKVFKIKPQPYQTQKLSIKETIKFSTIVIGFSVGFLNWFACSSLTTAIILLQVPKCYTNNVTGFQDDPQEYNVNTVCSANIPDIIIWIGCLVSALGHFFNAISGIRASCRRYSVDSLVLFFKIALTMYIVSSINLLLAILDTVYILIFRSEYLACCSPININLIMFISTLSMLEMFWSYLAWKQSSKLLKNVQFEYVLVAENDEYNICKMTKSEVKRVFRPIGISGKLSDAITQKYLSQLDELDVRNNKRF